MSLFIANVYPNRVGTFIEMDDSNFPKFKNCISYATYILDQLKVCLDTLEDDCIVKWDLYGEYSEFVGFLLRNFEGPVARAKFIIAFVKQLVIPQWIRDVNSADTIDELNEFVRNNLFFEELLWSFGEEDRFGFPLNILDDLAWSFDRTLEISQIQEILIGKSSGMSVKQAK